MEAITTWHEATEAFEEMLNEVYETVSLCGYEYEAGRVLREFDPIAFRQGLLDWIDSEGLDSDTFDN